MVPYLETGSQPRFRTVPYLETVCDQIQKQLERQPPRSKSSILETGGSNDSLFRNWIATPLSNGSIFGNCLQPYLETFRKATPSFQKFHIQKMVVPMVPYLETGLQPLFPTVPYLDTVCNHIQKRLRRQPSVSTVPCLENGGSNGSLFRNWIAAPFPTFQY